MIIPSFLSLALVILVTNKVVTIRSGKAFARNREYIAGQNSTSGISGSVMSNSETRQNNEAITIIAMLSLYHFFTYTPGTLVGTIRTSFGFLFSSSVNTLLAGILVRQYCVINTRGKQSKCRTRLKSSLI